MDSPTHSPLAAPWQLLLWGLRLTPIPHPRCAFFHGEVDKPAQGFLQRGGRRPVSVGISLDGVHVIDSREKVRPGSPGCSSACRGPPTPSDSRVVPTVSSAGQGWHYSAHCA